jgi:hypothetical protein
MGQHRELTHTEGSISIYMGFSQAHTLNRQYSPRSDARRVVDGTLEY